MVLPHTDLPADTERDKSQDQQPATTGASLVRTTELRIEALTESNATRPEEELRKEEEGEIFADYHEEFEAAAVPSLVAYFASFCEN